MKYRSKEQWQQAIDKIKADIASGMTLTQACKNNGTWPSTYKYQLKLRKKAPRSTRKASPKSSGVTSVMTVNVPPVEEDSICLIWGKSKDVRSALEQMHALRRS